MDAGCVEGAPGLTRGEWRPFIKSLDPGFHRGDDYLRVHQFNP